MKPKLNSALNLNKNIQLIYNEFQKTIMLEDLSTNHVLVVHSRGP